MRQKVTTPGPAVVGKWRYKFGHPHRHYARTDSTNTRARELAAAGAPHGTVVTAAEQTAGRGRQGRTWTAPPGSALLYSAIVRPLEPRHSMLPLAVPLAVCEVAEQLRPGIECKVKWPNDIHLEGKKLAGILIEARPQDGWAVLGIGLNLTIAPDEFPEDLRTRAVSLAPPQEASAIEAKAVLDAKLEAWLAVDADRVLAEWRRRDTLKGREVNWENGTGVADGVDERGYLLVRLADGDRVALGAGDVHLTSF
jgi:BirA family transcriptional regulator, biotin operon repressor / biotin---[acetyl-CoA-carboxylase] ligase